MKVSTGGMKILLKKGMVRPCEKSLVFRTSVQDQTVVELEVFQGEDTEDCSNNFGIGNLKVRGIPPAPKGEQKVKVIFKYD